MLTDPTTLIAIHTVISIIGLLLGIPAILALLGKPVPQLWTNLFLGFAVGTTFTGFFLPLETVTPAVVTGILSTIILIILFAAHYVFHFKGAWRWIYAVCMVLSVFLLAFVGIVQAFHKISFLHALVPVDGGPIFGGAHLINLAIFAVLGFMTVKKFRPAA